MPSGITPEVEIRLHGRGGQGTVVASLLLARAAMLEGKCVQSFPEFGVERRGAPVQAFLRIAGRPIRLRCKIYQPDHLLVLDRQLIPLVELPAGKSGFFVANTPEEPDDLPEMAPWTAATVDATRIARAHGLGSGAITIVNTPMTAAFARVTGLVRLESLLQAIREYAPAGTEANLAAAREAWDSVHVAHPWHSAALEAAFGGGA